MRLLEIEFNEDETKYKELQDYYNHIGQEALYMDHYQLAERTEESPIDWKEFLIDPRVSAFISEEMELLKKAKVAVMLRDVDTNKSTGQAQLLNTLLNQTKGTETKEGPAFIYTYIPLNENEAQAENVVILNEDDSN